MTFYSEYYTFLLFKTYDVMNARFILRIYIKQIRIITEIIPLTLTYKIFYNVFNESMTYHIVLCINKSVILKQEFNDFDMTISSGVKKWRIPQLKMTKESIKKIISNL
jgi:hypothetical protein